MKTAFLKILSGPVLAIITWVLFNPMTENKWAVPMAGIGVWMACWWLTEAVPLAVTSLLPLVLFPLSGVLDSGVVAKCYADPIIFLFIGGFIISFVIEKWNLHKRIALKVLMHTGNTSESILMGVMLTTFFISMWISNTATVMMLLAAVLAIVSQVESNTENKKEVRKFASALLIGLAYAASIGGMATLVGTPTNMIFYREYTTQFPNSNDLNFLSWFVKAFPVAIILLFAAFYILKYTLLKNISTMQFDVNYFKNEYRSLGKASFEEKIVMVVFVITALLWFTRGDIDFGFFKFNGWSNLFEDKNRVGDSTVAIFSALILFLIPSNKGSHILEWNDVKKLPFDIVLLFGGGFALAEGVKVSGLSDWMAGKISVVSSAEPLLFIFILCVLVTLISEFASNVACIQLMLPVLIAVGSSLNIPMLMLLIPATLASSLGFMLPVATAPNTIAFSSGHIKVNEMMKAGFLVDLVGIVIITVLSMLN